jgi:hypothetical protein
MTKPIESTLLLIVSIVFSTWLYPTVVGLWATVYIPYTHIFPRTHFFIGAWLSLGAASGAAICAFIIALPLGYLTKEKPIIIGSTFGVIATAIHVVIFSSILDEFNWFVGSITIAEHLSFILSCIVFARLGSYLATKKFQNGEPPAADGQAAAP